MSQTCSHSQNTFNLSSASIVVHMDAAQGDPYETPAHLGKMEAQVEPGAGLAEGAGAATSGGGEGRQAFRVVCGSGVGQATVLL